MNKFRNYALIRDQDMEMKFFTKNYNWDMKKLLRTVSLSILTQMDADTVAE